MSQPHTQQGTLQALGHVCTACALYLSHRAPGGVHCIYRIAPLHVSHRAPGVHPPQVQDDSALGRLRRSLSPLAGHFSMPLQRKPNSCTSSDTALQPSAHPAHPPAPLLKEGGSTAAVDGGGGTGAVDGAGTGAADKAPPAPGQAGQLPANEGGRVRSVRWSPCTPAKDQDSPPGPGQPSGAAASPHPALPDTPFVSPAAALALQQQLLSQPLPPEGHDPALPMPPLQPRSPTPQHQASQASPHLPSPQPGGLHACPVCKHTTCPVCRSCLGLRLPPALPPPGDPQGLQPCGWHAEASGPLLAAHRRLRSEAHTPDAAAPGQVASARDPQAPMPGRPYQQVRSPGACSPARFTQHAAQAISYLRACTQYRYVDCQACAQRDRQREREREKERERES